MFKENYFEHYFYKKNSQALYNDFVERKRAVNK